jgi:hypothetical protein
MFNQNLNPKYKELNRIILNLLDEIKKQKFDKNKIIQHLEAINNEVEKFQTEKIIYNNLDLFDQVNDFIHKITQESDLTNTNIKNILKKYQKIIKNINYKEKKLKKIVITTTLLAALGIGTHFSKNEVELIQDISPKEKITEEINKKENLYLKYNINPKFYNNQKNEMIKVVENFQIENKFLQHLNNLKIYNSKSKTLTPENFNLNLFNYLKSLSKSDNISFKLLLFITTVESSFGDERLSHSGALGPLQVMPATIKENCYNKYRNLFKTDEDFYKDLGVQLKAGIYELQKIARGYNIDIPNNSELNKYDLAMISASYNAGYGYFKRNPEQINNPTSTKGKEVYKYVRKVLTLNSQVQNIN